MQHSCMRVLPRCPGQTASQVGQRTIRTDGLRSFSTKTPMGTGAREEASLASSSTPELSLLQICVTSSPSNFS